MSRFIFLLLLLANVAFGTYLYLAETRPATTLPREINRDAMKIVAVADPGKAATDALAARKLADSLKGKPIPPKALDASQEGIGNAFAVAAKAGGSAGVELIAAAKSAFVDAFHAGLLVGAGVALVGAIAVFIYMPARARREDLEMQAEEYSASTS